jgi:hypothetical protein
MKKIIIGGILASSLFFSSLHTEESQHVYKHSVVVTSGGWWGSEPVLATVIINGDSVYVLNGRRIEIYDDPSPFYQRIKVCPDPHKEPCYIEWIPVKSKVSK